MFEEKDYQEYIFKEVFKFAKSSAPKLYKTMRAYFSTEAQPPLEKWRTKINYAFEGEFKIFCEVHTALEIKIENRHPLSLAQKEIASSKKKELIPPYYTNDPHAILNEEPFWNDDPLVFHANTLDFSEVLALRELDEKPEILSSCVILVCPDTERLAVQRRSDKVHTYPKHLHTFGGAFIPPIGGVDPDRKGFKSTMKREVFEETQISLAFENSPPIIVSKELGTGFIQVTYLGMPITASDLDEYEGNWEGEMVRIPFSELPDKLTQENWVPTGLGQILCWLAFGAPGAGKNPRFGKFSSPELFQHVLNARMELVE